MSRLSKPGDLWRAVASFWEILAVLFFAAGLVVLFLGASYSFVSLLILAAILLVLLAMYDESKAHNQWRRYQDSQP